MESPVSVGGGEIGPFDHGIEPAKKVAVWLAVLLEDQRARASLLRF